MLYVWLLLGTLLLLVEAVTLNCATVFFAAGAFFTSLTALLGIPWWMQLLVFAMLSAGLTVLLRRAMMNALLRIGKSGKVLHGRNFQILARDEAENDPKNNKGDGNA